jgi:hypothetical protein
VAAALVFGVWYPYPYREISGGRELFLIVVTVDVIWGHCITLAVFNRTKPWTGDCAAICHGRGLPAVGGTWLWLVDGLCGAAGAPGF